MQFGMIHNRTFSLENCFTLETYRCRCVKHATLQEHALSVVFMGIFKKEILYTSTQQLYQFILSKAPIRLPVTPHFFPHTAFPDSTTVQLIPTPIPHLYFSHPPCHVPFSRVTTNLSSRTERFSFFLLLLSLAASCISETLAA